MLYFLTLVLFTNVPGNAYSQHQPANRQLFSGCLGQNFWHGNLSRVGISFLFPIVQNVCVVLNACGSNGKSFYPIIGSLYCSWPHLTGEKLGTDIFLLARSTLAVPSTILFWTGCFSCLSAHSFPFLRAFPMENYKSFVHPFDVNLLEMIFASLQPKVSFSRTWELSV